MVDALIDAVPDTGYDAGSKGQTLVMLVYRRLRRVAVRIRAAGELSCIDQRLLDDAGLTRKRYLDTAE